MHRQTLIVLTLAAVACGPALTAPPFPTATNLPATTAATPAPQSTATAPPASPTPVPPTKLGLHLLLDDGRNVWPEEIWPAHLQAARDQLGPGGYVLELIRVDDLDITRWQVFLDHCTALDLRPILRLATTFDQTAGYWVAPLADPDGGYAQVARDYAAFVAGLRWPTPKHPVIVGNEPNHGDEWGGRADPAAYARFLADVADALHTADPEVLVLNAPLDPYSPDTNGQPFINGFTYVDSERFLDEMRATVADVFTRLDAWGSHAYPTGPLANGPWDQTFQIDRLNGGANPNHVEPPAGLFNRGINGYAWELYKLERLGVRDLEVWITETGWRHAETTDSTATDGGRGWPPVASVAQWIGLALDGNGGRYPAWPEAGWTPWRHDPRVRAVVFFAFNGAPREWGHTNWLELDDAGAILGAYPLLPTPVTAP